MFGRLLPLFSAALAVVSTFIAPATASAETRMALVIGNGGYQNVARLATPAADARAVAQMFREAGFESVDLVLDGGHDALESAVAAFKTRAAGADVAVVYFSGHGIEVGGVNYLVPVDARLTSDGDVEKEAVRVDRAVSAVQRGKRLGLVMLDACRDNPFIASMRRTPAGYADRVHAVEPSSTDLLIAYAMKAGGTCADTGGPHSPYTTALLRHLAVPGIDVRIAFARIRRDVLVATDNRQEIFVYGALGGDLIALVPISAQPQPADDKEIEADFKLVDSIGTRRAYEIFLQHYPQGPSADKARERIKAMDEKAKQH